MADYVIFLRIPLKEGIGGERRPKDRVTLSITSDDDDHTLIIQNKERTVD